jgi:hypothetical protein
MSMPDSEAKKKWIKDHTTIIRMKLNNNTDADIIAKLQGKKSRQGYIKELIRKDITNTNN